MRRLSVLLLGLALTSASVLSMTAVAQEGPGGPPPMGDAAAPGGQGGPGGPDGGPGNGPPRGAPGGVHLIPPFVREKLNLTADQQQQLAALEKETTEKVNKILTPEQQKTLAETRPPRPQGGRGGRPGGQGGQGGGGGGQGAPDGMGPPQ